MIPLAKPPTTRVCIGPCGLEKPIASFSRDARGHRRRVCGACVQEKVRRGLRATCVQCHAPIGAGRLTRHSSTCSRTCLLASIGLPPTFAGLADLKPGVERETRHLLEAVLSAPRRGTPRRRRADMPPLPSDDAAPNGDELQQRRVALRMTQRRLALTSGLSRSLIAGIELGTRHNVLSRLQLAETLHSLEQRAVAP